MKKTLSFLLTFLIAVFTYGQEQEFKTIVDSLQANLFEVKTGDETYTHEIELVEHSVLKYTLVEVDNKGNREELAYEFNVGDLDPYVVREETKKDIIYVSLTIENGQKFIKGYENGDIKGYEENMLIATKNIENARTISDLIKKAIPVAKKIMSNKLTVETYEEMEAWLVENVVTAESSGKTYKQSLVALEDYPGNFKFIQTKVTAKLSEETQMTFNLADININSMKFNISGSDFSLEFETNRKQKVVKIQENGVPEGFDDEIKIFTNNVEEARDLKNILSRAVPLAEKTVEASIQKFETLEPAMEFLKSLIKDIDYGDEAFEQSIEGNCILNYNLVESDPKSTTRSQAEFNLIDMNINLIDYDVTSDKMYVELLTKEKIDLFRMTENGEFDGYEDELRFYTENVEVARRLKAVFEDLISICERDYIDPFEGQTTKQKIVWLTENMGEVRVNDETITQTFEVLDPEDADKFKLTKLSVDSKGGTEEIFEFNFTDLNPKSIQYDIRSKILEVSLETKFKEDIVKYYKDGEIENYQDGFELSFSSIEDARNVILVFNQIIEELNR
jgi:hypothetical protein